MSPEKAKEIVPKPEGWSGHIAYWVSQIGSPPLMAMLTVILFNLTLSLPHMWLWSGIYLLLTLLFPLLYVILQVRRGNITDMDIHLREQRHRPFIIAIIGSAISLSILYLGGAPLPLIAVAGIVVIQSLCIFLITLRWKISVHSATATTMAVLSYKVVGSPAWPLLVTVPIIAWSRVKLRRHTPAQTMAGILLGGLITLLGLSILPLLLNR